MKAAISFLVGLSLTACLYFGQGPAHDFAFYVLCALNVMCWVGVLCGGISGKAAEGVRSRAWLSGLGSVLQIAAMVASGHPILAASSFCVTSMIVALAFGEKSEVSR